MKAITLLALFLLSIFTLSACSTSNVSVDLTGKINILAPSPEFNIEDLPDDWSMNGEMGGGSKVVSKSNVPALLIINGGDNFALSRHLKASLLATPYLNWAWLMEQPQKGPHPVRLVIGLKGGPNSEETEIGGSLLGFNISNNSLPAHNRTLVINWGETAIQRGNRYPENPDKFMKFTARGGRENAGHWLMEHIDISELYRRSWPKHDLSKIQIVFIGFSGVSGFHPTEAYFTGVQLSR